MIKNNYIHTTTPNVSILNKSYQQPIYEHSKTCLISLIHALNSKGFDYSMIDRSHLGEDNEGFLCTLTKYKRDYLQDVSPLILDSGGYSIIAGDVPVISINPFIECYIEALVKLRNVYDYVFSLDIPVFINWKEGDKTDPNTYEFIKDCNKRSLERSIEAIKEYPEIGDKFNMVLQWKMPQQYRIWDELYDELDMKSYVNSYAVGGLVGLLGMCPDINFAPFIGPCYYWLYRYIEKGDFSKPLFIHILGQYHKSSRFMIFFLQALFTDYLKTVNQTCIITYDTINYTISSMFKTRVGVEVYYFDENKKFNTVHSYELEDNILSKIYTTDESLKNFHLNWDQIKKDEPLIDTSFLVPTYVYSQLQLDKFFEYFIAEYDLVNVFKGFDSSNLNQASRWKRVCKKLEYQFSRFKPYSSTLTSNFNRTVLKSMEYSLQFHTDFINNPRDKALLDFNMKLFINKINFPFDLAT